MATYIQYDIFGKRVEPSVVSRQASVRRTRRLALAVQMAVANLDDFSQIMEYVGQLCTEITGIAYPFDVQHISEKKLEKAKAAEPKPETPKKRGRGRPRGKKDSRPRKRKEP